MAPLSPADRQKDRVTFVTCRTLLAAHMVAARLRGAGIEPLLPDEHLMQAVGRNVNTYGYVRVQLSPHDYAAAAELFNAVR